MPREQNVSVREYGHLVQKRNTQDNITGNAACISDSAWHWLEKEALKSADAALPFLSLRMYRGRRSIRVANYVGLLSTPCGCKIEVLPKISNNDNESVDALRNILLKMLTLVWNLPIIEHQISLIEKFHTPLLESLISLYLQKLAELFKRGLRKGYSEIHEDKKYLKGKLMLIRQLRKGPGKETSFSVKHRPFIFDRAENRLIKKTLEWIASVSSMPKNIKLTRQFLYELEDIPSSSSLLSDMKKWSHNRNMGLYSQIKPWVELILSRHSPLSMSGSWEGISLLFPMERLFEEYVGKKLSRMITAGYSVRLQSALKKLISHNNNQWFRLKPDIIVLRHKRVVSLFDAKWKLIDERLGNGKDKYGLSQQDMYQLFAYGEKYLGGKGELYLVYPMSQYFNDSLEPFYFKDDLRLFVIPYDLDKDTFLFHHEGLIHEALKTKATTLT